MSAKDSMHWADQTARIVIQRQGKKKQYVCAAGITPSGTVHIGNFREMITVDIIARALRDAKQKTRFIYSWDDFDVFRKVPVNMPKQDVLKKHLRYPITEVPDTHGCHKSYAEHNEKEVEDQLPKVGIEPELLYQQKKYQNCDYAEEIKFVLNNKEKARVILNEHRKEPLEKNWIPLSVYCEKCHTDNTKITNYDGNYKIKYTCDCNHKDELDFRKKGLVKLPWRLDWPMRWCKEKVDFEPGGKEHSTTGGSYSTAKEIRKELYNEEPPFYIKYDFINIKGGKGKMSSSSGNVVTLKDTLDIYEPEIVRYLFAGTRPGTEFNISFDLDVIKVYEDYDKCERIYFKKEEVSEKEYQQQKRNYELSQIKTTPKKIPFQPRLRHLLNVLQIYSGDEKRIQEHFKKEVTSKEDKEKLQVRIQCAKNWLDKYAPEEFKFEVNKSLPTLTKKEKEIVKAIKEKISKAKNEKQLHESFYEIAEQQKVETKELFQTAYKALINKEKGPRLANFIFTIGKKEVMKLFS